MLAVRIPVPCLAKLGRHAGDRQSPPLPAIPARRYNFSEMTAFEINQGVAARAGRLCARFYQRPDGTMLAEDCTERIPAQVQRSARIAATILAALVTIAPAKATPASPQSGSSSIEIQSAREGLTLLVKDPSGAVLPGATVSLVSAKTGQHWDLTTDSNGGVVLPDLPPGYCDLTLRAFGFSSLVKKNLIAPSRVVITLQVARSGGIEIRTASNIETTPSEIPAVLVEPGNARPNVPLKPSDHRNALQRFFSKLHHVF